MVKKLYTKLCTKISITVISTYLTLAWFFCAVFEKMLYFKRWQKYFYNMVVSAVTTSSKYRRHSPKKKSLLDLVSQNKLRPWTSMIWTSKPIFCYLIFLFQDEHVNSQKSQTYRLKKTGLKCIDFSVKIRQ